MSKGRLLVFVAAGALLAPVLAFASHGKAGLWEITTTISMPNMPQTSPAQMAQMQAMGVHMPTQNTMSFQHCMSAADVAQDKPPPMRNKDCALSNIKLDGRTFSGDMVCSGRFQGQGHYSVTYDSDEHYSGSTSMTGTADGHPVNSSTSFEGKWVAADCGAAK